MHINRIFFSNGIILILLLVTGTLFSKKKQDERLNWSIFFSAIYLLISVPLLDHLCVKLGFWIYKENDSPILPLDLCFLWVVFWSVITIYISKTKYFLIVLIFIFWIDFLLIPQLDNLGYLQLGRYWIIGETIMICFAFIPSYLWAKSYYQKKYLWFRAVNQILVMIFFFFVILPYLLYHYKFIDYINYNWSFLEIQFLLIISFPAFVAVMDLVEKGKGTPFPYDQTKKLVETGVYAYCKNPIDRKSVV